MEFEREIEKCPTCNTTLEHIIVKGEDVFGCPECRKEVSRDNAVIVLEYYCPYCKMWYDVDDGHSCWEKRSGLC